MKTLYIVYTGETNEYYTMGKSYEVILTQTDVNFLRLSVDVTFQIMGDTGQPCYVPGWQRKGELAIFSSLKEYRESRINKILE
jgi:hypothetical protein